MTPDETIKLLTWVQSLWPEWTPSDDELAEWRTLAEELTYDDAEAAFRAHWRSPRKWKTPQAGAVLAAFREARQQGRRGPDWGHVACAADPPAPPGDFIGGWVSCTEGPLLGRVTTRWSGSSGLPSREEIVAMLNDVRDLCERVHGGTWVVVLAPDRPLTLQEYRAAEHDGIKQRMAALDRPRRIRRREAPTP